MAGKQPAPGQGLHASTTSLSVLVCMIAALVLVLAASNLQHHQIMSVAVLTMSVWT